MPLTERNFRRKRKQLPELQASQEHEGPYTSALLKDAKCRDGSLSRGRLFPCHSSFTLDLNPPPCSWHPRSQAHPSECITVVTDDPRARLIWDMGLLCGHRTDIPWRQPQWAGGVAALPPTERGQCRLKPSSQQKPLAGFPGWLAGWLGASHCARLARRYSGNNQANIPSDAQVFPYLFTIKASVLTGQGHAYHQLTVPSPLAGNTGVSTGRPKVYPRCYHFPAVWQWPLYLSFLVCEVEKIAYTP